MSNANEQASKEIFGFGHSLPVDKSVFDKTVDHVCKAVSRRFGKLSPEQQKQVVLLVINELQKVGKHLVKRATGETTRDFPNTTQLQRNFRVAGLDADALLKGVTPDRLSAARAICKRYHTNDRPASVNCLFCKGEGWEKAEQRRLGQLEHSNHPRHLGKGGVELG